MAKKVETNLTVTISSLTLSVPRRWCDREGTVDPEKAEKAITYHINEKGQLVITFSPSYEVEEINLSNIEIEVDGQRTFYEDEDQGEE